MMSMAELREDHPRIRGEHATKFNDEEEGTGSSPHSRGAPDLRATAGGSQRIIPAFAGSTIT